MAGHGIGVRGYRYQNMKVAFMELRLIVIKRKIFNGEYCPLSFEVGTMNLVF